MRRMTFLAAWSPPPSESFPPQLTSKARDKANTSAIAKRANQRRA
jgi:hypothetical protein